VTFSIEAQQRKSVSNWVMLISELHTR